MSANRMSVSGHHLVDVVALKRERRPSLLHLYLGAPLWLFIVGQAALGVSWPALHELQRTFSYQLGSGALLASYLWVQWQVPLLRLLNRPAAAKQRLGEHRLVGALGPLVWYLHSTTLGVRYTMLLSVLFLANGLLGLLNRETLAVRSKAFAQGWLVLHVALAVSVLALSVLHACTALYYE